MFFLEHHIMLSTLVANKLLCFSVFTGRENSFSVSFANPILTIPELFSLMDLRAADLVVSVCTGQAPQPLLLDKGKSFLISVRSIQRVKQRIWSDLRKAWLRIKRRAKWVFHYFMSKAPERNRFLFVIIFYSSCPEWVDKHIVDLNSSKAD